MNLFNRRKVLSACTLGRDEVRDLSTFNIQDVSAAGRVLLLLNTSRELHAG